MQVDLLATGERSLPRLAEAGKTSGVLADLGAFFESHSHGSDLKPIALHPKDPEVGNKA